MMAELKEFAKAICALTVKEVNELADVLKNEYGIEPAAAAAAVASKQTVKRFDPYPFYHGKVPTKAQVAFVYMWYRRQKR